MALLSWDDFDEPKETLTAVAKAIENNAKLDTKPFEDMVAIEEKAFSEQKAATASSSAMERAIANVNRMKEEDPTGERILAKDKFLINCTTDLNQLVPFKYNWAWSLYLTACENHWMPSELEFEKDKDIFDRFTEQELRIVYRAYGSHRLATHWHSDAAHLNLYAKITNPECRQTLLKQVMERATHHHLWVEMEEALGIDWSNLGLFTGDPDSVKDLYKLRNAFCGDYLIDGTSTTNTLEGAQQLALVMAHYYFHSNLMLVVPIYYQLWQLAKKYGSESLRRMVHHLARDIQSQLAFGTLFLETAINEGSIIIEQSTLDKIYNFIDRSTDALVKYIGGEETLTLLNYLTDRSWGKVFDGVGNRSNGQNYSVELGEFIGMFDELSPEVDHSATIGGGGSLNW